MIVRVPVRKGVSDRARDGKPDTDRERDGETELLLHGDCDRFAAALNVGRCVPSIE